MDQLSRRTLNRTTLDRQSLLNRSTVTAKAMVEQLVGMQAQNPNDPYFALWSRIDHFEAQTLSTMVERGEAVRGALMRATIHLATTPDFLSLRPQLQSVCARTLGSTVFARDSKEVDREALLRLGRSLLDGEPMTRARLGPLLEAEWPGVPGASLAQVVTYLLPVVQVPPRGLWQQTGAAAWTTVESWTGSELMTGLPVEDVLRRYLAAFGPASVADMRAWSGLSGLKEIVDRMRPQLRVFRSESGVELLDVPDAPVVDDDTPAPPRFLPEYDNVLLGHSDRSRFFLEGVVPQGWVGNLLVDGMFSGGWKVHRGRGGHRMEIMLQRAIPRAEVEAVVEEGNRLLAFVGPGNTSGEVTLLTVD
jgi:hypothetical protein